MKLCPCHSNKRYLDCCGPFLLQKSLPNSPETLMRSRYTAFVEGNLTYIKRTMKGPALADFNKNKHNKKTQWISLEIIESSIDPDNSDIGYVEFKARYKTNKQTNYFHEKSIFNKINNKWYYVDGKMLNDPNANPVASHPIRKNRVKLPPYQAIDFKHNHHPKVLREPAQKLTFPLSKEDLSDIETLEKKYDNEVNCAGLAAPQIGISKQIIVFGAEENPELKKWRPDFSQTMSKSIWINPSFEPIGTEKHEDYEGCFSVLNRGGPVQRYKKVRYTAYDIHGERITGTAEGFLARIIQHEIDHLQGKLFLDYVPKDQLIDLEDLRMKRKEAGDTSIEED